MGEHPRSVPFVFVPYSPLYSIRFCALDGTVLSGVSVPVE